MEDIIQYNYFLLETNEKESQFTQQINYNKFKNILYIILFFKNHGLNTVFFNNLYSQRQFLCTIDY